MKPIFTIALACLLSHAKAQYMSNELNIGGVVSLGKSWLTNIDGNQELHPSYSIGGTVKYQTLKHWGFAADLLYAVEGTKFNIEKDKKYTYKVNLEYLRLPLTVYYHFNYLQRSIRPKIGLGPSLGYLLTERTMVNDGFYNYDTEFSNNFNKIDLGVHGNVGVNVKLAHEVWLNTELIYYHGSSLVSTINKKEIKNRNTLVQFHLTFTI